MPTAASVWKDKLPAGAPSADEEMWIQKMYNNAGVKNIDLASALKLHREEDIYYRTDHHWTSLGAFYGANAILEGMGMEELLLADYTPTAVSDDFLGTNYSAAGAWWVEPDPITVYVPEEGKEVISNFIGRGRKLFPILSAGKSQDGCMCRSSYRLRISMPTSWGETSPFV